VSDVLTADDLLALIAKLAHDEKLRLAKIALRAAATGSDDAASYSASPPGADEFRDDHDSLGWEGDGWEAFSAPR
jgi:hypothetical protein